MITHPPDTSNAAIHMNWTKTTGRSRRRKLFSASNPEHARSPTMRSLTTIFSLFTPASTLPLPWSVCRKAQPERTLHTLQITFIGSFDAHLYVKNEPGGKVLGPYHTYTQAVKLTRVHACFALEIIKNEMNSRTYVLKLARHGHAWARAVDG
jgi:hypothetical protein